MSDEIREENRKLKRAIAELRILNEVSVAISSAVGVDAVTDLIVKKCVEHAGAEQGAIWLLDPIDKTAPPKTFLRVMDSDVNTLPFKVGASVMGWVIKNRIPLIVNDVIGDKRFVDLAGEYSDLRCLIAVPLRLKDALIGVICLLNKTGGQGFSNDDARLLTIVASQSAQTIENARLYDDERRLRSLEEDLRTARVIQYSLLPRENPRADHFDIAGLYEPAQMIGGDYFDFIPIDKNHLGIAIADVAGKGTSAALLMANLQSCLRGQAILNRSPRETINSLNFMLSRYLVDGRFITAIYGVLDVRRGIFTYVNAGHCWPIFVGGDRIVELEEGGIVLGFSADSKYTETQVSLQAGESILLYTDGITEAANASEEQYGESRLLDLVRTNPSLSAAELVHLIKDSVVGFQDAMPQSDDITLVAVRNPL
jgi:phosphoserine phosphatase RsbU/P